MVIKPAREARVIRCHAEDSQRPRSSGRRPTVKPGCNARPASVSISRPELKVPARWIGPLTVGIALGGLLFLAFALWTWIGRAEGWAFDFRAYYDAVERLASTGTPYQAATVNGPFQPTSSGLYLYSPVPAVLMLPLSALSLDVATIAWLGLRLVVLVVTCALMPVARPIRLATLGIAAMSWPVLYDLNLGNVSLFITFLAVLGWRQLDRPLGSLALAAAITIRPTMALLAASQLVRGAWRPLALTGVALFGLVLLTLPFVGIGGWADYLTLLRNVQGVTGEPSNVDLASALLRLGGPAWAASVALVIGYAVAVAAVLLSLRRDRELSYVVTVVATLLLSPLLWEHYLTLLLLPAAFLASRGRIWGLGLLLLGWLPAPVLPFVALLALWLPFLTADRGEAAGMLFKLRART